MNQLISITHIVSITSKGQATIPKELREKYGFKNKARVIATPEGILFKPLPSPEEEFGSMKTDFNEKYGDTSVWDLLDKEKRIEDQLEPGV
ncbi:MAG TPA: AbrB/MazE/SpoVT family DNA-binding domain-containing protein [Candidatus Bathyarchaeota archaeon]|nr:AbrB/MazE/SpoVT family DNA-binding domain-containing protein [Candidatus Bathyarchaeota archaeon]